MVLVPQSLTQAGPALAQRPSLQTHCLGTPRWDGIVSPLLSLLFFLRHSPHLERPARHSAVIHSWKLKGEKDPRCPLIGAVHSSQSEGGITSSLWTRRSMLPQSSCLLHGVPHANTTPSDTRLTTTPHPTHHILWGPVAIRLHLPILRSLPEGEVFRWACTRPVQQAVEEQTRGHQAQHGQAHTDHGWL